MDAANIATASPLATHTFSSSGMLCKLSNAFIAWTFNDTTDSIPSEEGYLEISPDLAITFDFFAGNSALCTTPWNVLNDPTVNFSHPMLLFSLSTAGLVDIAVNFQFYLQDMGEASLDMDVVLFLVGSAEAIRLNATVNARQVVASLPSEANDAETIALAFFPFGQAIFDATICVSDLYLCSGSKTTATLAPSTTVSAASSDSTVTTEELIPTTIAATTTSTISFVQQQIYDLMRAGLGLAVYSTVCQSQSDNACSLQGFAEYNCSLSLCFAGDHCWVGCVSDTSGTPCNGTFMYTGGDASSIDVSLCAAVTPTRASTRSTSTTTTSTTTTSTPFTGETTTAAPGLCRPEAATVTWPFEGSTASQPAGVGLLQLGSRVGTPSYDSDPLLGPATALCAVWNSDAFVEFLVPSNPSATSIASFIIFFRNTSVSVIVQASTVLSDGREVPLGEFLSMTNSPQEVAFTLSTGLDNTTVLRLQLDGDVPFDETVVCLANVSFCFSQSTTSAATTTTMAPMTSTATFPTPSPTLPPSTTSVPTSCTIDPASNLFIAGCDGGYSSTGCAFYVRLVRGSNNNSLPTIPMVANEKYTIIVHFNGILITSRLTDSDGIVLATTSLPLVAPSLSVGLVLGRDNNLSCTTSYTVSQGRSTPVQYLGSPLWQDPSPLNTASLAPQLRGATPGQPVCGQNSDAAVLAGTVSAPFTVTVPWSGHGLS